MSVLQACQRCGAYVRPDAEWCSLCFARVDEPAPEPPPPLPPSSAAEWLDAPRDSADELHEAAAAVELTPAPVSGTAEPVDPLTAPLELLDAPAGGHAQVTTPPSSSQPAALSGALEAPAAAVPASTESADPPDPEDPERSVEAMLAMLAVENHGSDQVTRWADRLADRPTRVLVMIGGIVVLSVLMFGMLAIVSVFT